MTCCNPRSSDSQAANTSGQTQLAQGCGCATTQSPAATARDSFTPAHDVVRSASGDGLLIIADMPGCRPSDLEITAEGGVLTIVGRVAPRPTPAGPEGFLLQEYGIGDYRVAFKLPAEVDAERISASLADGVLRVTLPTRAELSRRRIAVTN